MVKGSLCVLFCWVFVGNSPVQGQDVLHLVDGQRVSAKIHEVGLDSIHYTHRARSQRISTIPRYQVRYIEYENGQTYFVIPTKLYLTNGKIILVHIQESDDTIIEYLELYTGRRRRLSTKKVAAVSYEDGTETYYTDKINLRSGGFVAGQVLEVNEKAVVLEDASRRARKRAIARSRVQSIEFKNGYKQHFLSTQTSSDMSNYEN